MVREDPLRMPDVTAQAPGRWIQMCVEHAERGWVDGYTYAILQEEWEINEG